MKKTNKHINFLFLILIIGMTFTSCMWDEPTTAKKITKDYYLHWIYDNSDQSILKSSDKGKSGTVEVSETVFAVGFNDNYIIAKQHPNLEEQISERLFGKRGENGDYLLTNPNDTIYLWKEDRFYEENGKWYHIINGWNPPDSLKPYRKKTNYHIIDIRKRENYVFDNKTDFLNKRKELGISENLNFTIIDKELE